jgi:quinol monooxygenase YgiN
LYFIESAPYPGILRTLIALHLNIGSSYRARASSNDLGLKIISNQERLSTQMRGKMDKINRDESIVNLTRIAVCPVNQKELFQTISSLIGLVKREKGCLEYHFYQEAGDENAFVLIGEWETRDAWSSHLSSDNFAILLGSISLLCHRTHIDFELLSHVADIEEITRVRIGCHP